MLPVVIKLKVATTAAFSLAAATSPIPLPAESLSMVVVERSTEPVEVKLYDENLHVHATVGIRRDGTMDEATQKEVTHLFRCRQTGREHPIATRTLAMLADLAEKYDDKT